MKNLLKNQRGIGHIVMIVVFALIIAGVGYVTYQTRQATNTAEHTKPVTPADPYDGWNTYTDTRLGLTFRYPSDWKSKTILLSL